MDVTAVDDRELMRQELADLLRDHLTIAPSGDGGVCIDGFDRAVEALMRGPVARLEAEAASALDVAESWEATAGAEAEIGNERAAENRDLRARLVGMAL